MDQEVRQFLRLESLYVLLNIARISSPILRRSNFGHIDAELLPLLLRHSSLVLVKRAGFEESPAEKPAEIAYETQINEMHDIKWHRNGKMHSFKEDKRRDPLDASSSCFLGIAGTRLAISLVILCCPSNELRNMEANCTIPL